MTATFMVRDHSSDTAGYRGNGNALAIPCVGCTSAQSMGLHALVAVGTFARRIEIEVKMVPMGVI